ncbi:unnamed protein product [marine sediment metagenome]|uniref:Uncharacterized protein n=1 Tax=marine sediment metagenome TaxID=412755 RepID=X1LIA0_9ZZZZ
MNKKILAVVIIAILIFVGIVVLDLTSETQTKQGILTNIEYVSDTSYTLTFDDGVELTFKEDNAEDAQEMYEGLIGWTNQEIVIEYTYSYWIMGYFLNSYYSPVD